MKKLNTILLSAAVIGSLGLFSSCTDETTTPPATGNPPSGLAATSIDKSTIGVTWAGDGLTDTAVAMDAAGATAATATGTSTAQLTGLSENTVYTIVVRSSNGTSASLKWMTAERTSGIRLYDLTTPSSTGFSALQLSNGSGQAQAISFSGASAANADFVLDTLIDPSFPSGLVLVAADAYDATYHADRIYKNTDYLITGGLSAMYLSTDLNNLSDVSTADAYGISDANVGTTEKILIIKTQDGHYAKIGIVPQANGKMYGVNGSGNKFIDVDVSYQAAANQPYAARPRTHGRANKRNFAN